MSGLIDAEFLLHVKSPIIPQCMSKAEFPLCASALLRNKGCVYTAELNIQFEFCSWLMHVHDDKLFLWSCRSLLFVQIISGTLRFTKCVGLWVLDAFCNGCHFRKSAWIWVDFRINACIIIIFIYTHYIWVERQHVLECATLKLNVQASHKHAQIAFRI